MMGYFCIGVSDAIEKVSIPNGVKVFMFADDVTICGPAKHVEAVTQSIILELPPSSASE